MKFLKKIQVLLLALLVCGMSYAQDKENKAAVQDTTKADVIVQPSFRGGISALYQYISDNFAYPEQAAKRSVNGTMEVEFTVERSGDITNVGILQGLDFSVDDEILRLLKAMPRWIPATKNGVPVRYKLSMPLNIRVSRNKKSSLALSDFYDN
ncbi:MAG: energy transducer TonB [Bacteroidaceae bacterium]|nr:energy transducer TonB [Bacteroidaceae bacterium]